MTASATQPDYVLGHAERELKRLGQQAGFFADATRAGLARAGLNAGMRVLDIGCGIGDVSFIASELVGPNGVTGIDISAGAVAAAKQRAAAGGFAVEFAEGKAEDFARYDQFEAVIGRFILLHMADPAALLRLIASRCRSGTRICFVEMDMGTVSATGPFPLLDRTLGRIREVYARMGLSADMGARLYPAFRAAGLTPDLYGYTRVGGSDDHAGFTFLAESVRSLAPAARPSSARVRSSAGSPASMSATSRSRGSAGAGRWCCQPRRGDVPPRGGEGGARRGRRQRVRDEYLRHRRQRRVLPGPGARDTGQCSSQRSSASHDDAAAALLSIRNGVGDDRHIVVVEHVGKHDRACRSIHEHTGQVAVAHLVERHIDPGPSRLLLDVLGETTVREAEDGILRVLGLLRGHVDAVDVHQVHAVDGGSAAGRERRCAAYRRAGTRSVGTSAHQRVFERVFR